MFLTSQGLSRLDHCEGSCSFREGSCAFLIHPTQLQPSCSWLVFQTEGAKRYLLQMPSRGNLTSQLPFLLHVSLRNKGHEVCANPWSISPAGKSLLILAISSTAPSIRLQIRTDTGNSNGSANLCTADIPIHHGPCDATLFPQGPGLLFPLP